MAKRLRKTLADIMVIGVSPVLIMTLVGSLLFFLLTVFYYGQYETRLTFIFGLFVMAAVLIARISMEEGVEYASLFAIPLAVVTGIAVVRFVRFEGALSGASTVINWALIALVWWCTHKLTWDCTLVDDNEDASGEGLLQSIGVDSDTLDDQSETGVSADHSAAASTDPAPNEKSPNWWQRMVDRRHRPHTPGVWVVYFSIAALLLFGFGQWFIPSEDVSSRRYAFQMLCVYIASALGLLLTTSFLGLRRYLRQRRLQMPTDMAGVWLGIGAVMIVALLIFCVILPRPGASASISQLPFGVGSPDHNRTHKRAFGNDGPERPDQATGTRTDAKQGGQPGSQGGQDGESSSRSKASGSKAGKSNGGGQQKGSGQKSGGQKGGEQKGGEQKGGGQKSGGQKGSGQGQKSSRQEGGGQKGSREKSSKGRSGSEKQRQGEGGQQGDDQRQSGPGEQAPDSSSDNRNSQNRERSGAMSDNQDRSDRQNPRESDSGQNNDGRSQSSRSFPARALQSATSSIGNLIKLLFFLLLLGIAIFFLWKYREKVRAALLQLLEDLKQLWARLFGGVRDNAEETDGAGEAEATEAGRPFSSYTDPFATGAAARYSTDQLVCYSFEALEAWARERACGREDEQTPLEFVRQVGHQYPDVASEARVLGDLYSRVAYGNERISTRRQQNLQRLWSQLRT